MTTIVYRNGQMAADTAGTNGGTRSPCVHTKIVKGLDGSLAGGAGRWPSVYAFLNWFEAGEAEDEKPKLIGNDESSDQVMIVRPSGDIELHDDDGWFPVRGAIFYAIGTGKEFAYGAMQQGANAVGAVEIAKMFDIYTGGDITSLKLGKE